MGELHLEIIVDRLKTEHKVEVKVGKPAVAFRETITQRGARANYKFKKQTGGKGQFAHIVMRIEPNPGLGIRIRQPHQGRQHPQGIHPGHRKGLPRLDGKGPLRRLPDGRRQVRPARRQLPRRRLQRAGLQDLRPAGHQGSHRQGGAAYPGADHEDRDQHPRRIHGRDHRRHQPPPRPHRQHAPLPQGLAEDQRQHPADGDVRLRLGAAHRFQRPRQPLHGVPAAIRRCPSRSRRSCWPTCAPRSSPRRNNPLPYSVEPNPGKRDPFRLFSEMVRGGCRCQARAEGQQQKSLSGQRRAQRQLALQGQE